MASKHKRVALTLSVDVAATPARVVKSAQAIEALARELDGGLSEESFTVVISNFDLRAELRAHDDRAESALGNVFQTAIDPGKHLADTPRARQIARALARLADEFRDDGPTLGLKGQRRRVKLTQRKSKELKAAADVPDPAVDLGLTLRGTSEIRSPVLRVGRLTDGGPLAARLVLESKPVEVPFESAAMDALLEGLRTGKLQKLTVSAAWNQKLDGSVATVPDSLRILCAEPAQVMSGAELLKHLPRLSQQSFDAMMGALREAREQDD